MLSFYNIFGKIRKTLFVDQIDFDNEAFDHFSNNEKENFYKISHLLCLDPSNQDIKALVRKIKYGILVNDEALRLLNIHWEKVTGINIS